MTDANWAALARSSREALRQAGYDLTVRCLPDEPGACGGSFAGHVMAHMAALKAVADHHLLHLGASDAHVQDIYSHTAASIDCELTCPARDPGTRP